MNTQKWLLACAITAQLTTVAFAAEKETALTGAVSTNAVAVKVQTLCPVMGGPIDKSQFVDYKGKRIYVCCGGCVAKIKKNPAKYVKQLEAEGITLAKAEPPKAK